MGTRVRKMILKGCIMALMVLMFIGCVHAAPAVTWTGRRITTNPADQVDPAISGDIIVYTDYSTGEGDVYAYDLGGNNEFTVTTSPGDQYLTDVSGGRIVYDDMNTADIWVYDIASHTAEAITLESPGMAVNPATGGSIVAWEDSRNNVDHGYDIYAKDLSTMEERRISSNPGADKSPAVDDRKIVWMGCTLTCDIYVYNWDDGTTRQITNSLEDERDPDIYGTLIVYSAQRSLDRDIVLYDLAASAQKVLELPGDQVNPNIWGDNVVFEDVSPVFYHLKLWNIPSDTVFDLPAPGEHSQYLNDIWGNRVVYTDDREGQLDIYLSEFTLTEGTIPVPEFPSLLLPVASLIGFLGVILHIRRTGSN